MDDHKKPELVIIHVGTNDITNNVKNLKKIFKEVFKESPSTSIAFPSIVNRKVHSTKK